MADTERTFKIKPNGDLKPLDDPKPLSSFTRLDCVGVPTTANTGKFSQPTSTVVIDNSSAALKQKLKIFGTPAKAITPPKGKPTLAAKPIPKGKPVVAPKKNLAVGLRPVQKKKLVSLDSWNQERSRVLEDAGQTGPNKNGIACPKCGAELYDMLPYWSNMNGTFIDVACAAEKCNYSGNRKA